MVLRWEKLKRTAPWSTVFKVWWQFQSAPSAHRLPQRNHSLQCLMRQSLHGEEYCGRKLPTANSLWRNRKRQMVLSAFILYLPQIWYLTDRCGKTVFPSASLPQNQQFSWDSLQKAAFPLSHLDASPSDCRYKGYQSRPDPL